ncbi:EAL domain-containing protein [Bacillus sp. BRMEA1]|uniref:EAL domain-containing protein n=1 Tax=Neobacillus endophyticus TaxID=2738405 RepID=UPI00156504FF|nr:EAL domain-containing protein [Neobacillus endophyticus]NRD76783.1 EAL domain-containing protein [Neobacillus endophyticus]
MLKIGRLPKLILVVNIAVLLGWDYLFWGNEWVRSLAVNVLEMFAVTFSFIGLFKAYLSFSGKSRIFWLLLSLGMLVYLVANFNWLYVQLTLGDTIFPSPSIFIWGISNCLFLAALLYKMKEISTSGSASTYLFNILVFMITVAAMVVQYLINPITFSNHSFPVTITLLSYPITDFSILFVVTFLYYLVQQSKGKELLLLLLYGFTLQVISDFAYMYMTIKGTYRAGGIPDIIWQVSLLLIGFAGFYAEKSKKEIVWEIQNPFKGKEIVFPYLSIVFLILLVSIDYRWKYDALTIGLLISFLMTIGRQLMIIKRNNKLVDEYRYLAHHDPLTGLNNRASFAEDLRKYMMKNNHKNSVAMLLIDLDRFKVVNDTLGHHVGDRILIKSSERLKQSLDNETLIYRLGGDEFVMILPDATEMKCALTAKNILKNFQSPFIVNGYEILVTPSIGISIFPESGEDLLKHADAAMYLAKENGKNRFVFFNNELNKTLIRKMRLENELRKAIDQNQIFLFYQPKVDLATKKLIGMEALLRWKHPELGWVSPLEFIPIAEETGQIVSIGEWVLNEACRQNMIWQSKGYPPLCVSVNVSVRQFQHSNFPMVVKKVLQETKLPPQFLELEITESIMQNIKESTEVLQGLRQIGVKTSIDDFGTGYSSLHVLQKLPIDTIKIDKSFIDDMENTSQQSMVKTIIDLGLSLHLSVVAEGIEHEYQMNSLLEKGCRIGQGYLFSKPVDSEIFEQMLITNDFTKVTLG